MSDNPLFDGQGIEFHHLQRLDQRRQTIELQKLLKEQERQRRGVGPCPHCGGGIPQVGVAVCMHCRGDLHWVEGLCGATKAQAQNLANAARYRKASKGAEHKRNLANKQAAWAEQQEQMELLVSRTLYLFAVSLGTGLIIYGCWGYSTLPGVLAWLSLVASSCVGGVVIWKGVVQASRIASPRPVWGASMNRSTTVSDSPNPPASGHPHQCFVRLPSGEIKGPGERGNIRVLARQGKYPPGTQWSNTVNGPWETLVDEAAVIPPVQFWIRMPDGRSSGPYTKEKITKAIAAGKLPGSAQAALQPSGPWQSLESLCS